MTLAGAKEAVIADLLEAFRQAVLQEGTDELLSGQGAGFAGTGGAVAVTESDLAILEFEEALVREGDAEDIRGQILERRLAGANGRAGYDPVLSPDRSGDWVERFWPKRCGTWLETDGTGA